MSGVELLLLVVALSAYNCALKKAGRYTINWLLPFEIGVTCRLIAFY